MIRSWMSEICSVLPSLEFWTKPRERDSWSAKCRMQALTRCSRFKMFLPYFCIIGLAIKCGRWSITVCMLYHVDNCMSYLRQNTLYFFRVTQNVHCALMVNCDPYCHLVLTSVLASLVAFGTRHGLPTLLHRKLSSALCCIFIYLEWSVVKTDYHKSGIFGS